VRFGTQEILIILVIILLLFGPTKLPQLAKSIGQSVNQLKEGMQKKPEEDEKNREAGESSESSTKED